MNTGFFLCQRIPSKGPPCAIIEKNPSVFFEVKELETKSVEGSSEWVELLNALEVAGGRFFLGGNHQDASNRINGWKSEESIPPSLVISFR